jgi:hypothetical protein
MYLLGYAVWKSLTLLSSTISGRDQRSRFTLSGRSSRAPSDHGKVHVEHAHNPLREQYFTVNRPHQEPMLAHAGSGS